MAIILIGFIVMFAMMAVPALRYIFDEAHDNFRWLVEKNNIARHYHPLRFWRRRRELADKRRR